MNDAPTGGGGGGYAHDGGAGACGGGAGGAYSSSPCGTGGQIDAYAAVINASFATGTAYGNVGGNGYSGKGYGAGGGGSVTSGTPGAGTDGLGGGGAGSGNWGTSGANGGSGVVIVRYAEPAGVVMVPRIKSKTYTGETLTADVPAKDGYTVTENNGGKDVGEYDVKLTLNDGYHWDGGSTEPTNLVFAITPAQNAWVDRTLAFTVIGAQDVPPFTVTMGEVTAVEGASQVDLSVGYTVASEVPSEKTVTLYALIFEDGSAETNRVTLAEGVEMDDEATGTIENLTPGMSYWVALYGEGGATVSPTTPFRKVTMKGPATDLQGSATFTNDPKKEFVITGSFTPGLGTTTVTVYYHDQNTEDFTPDTPTLDENNAFVVRVPYTGLYDHLTWYVTVENTFGEQVWNPDTNPELQTPQQTKNRLDTAPVTYTWTGVGADNSWQNPDNWSADVAVCFGFPDNANATAKFTKDAVVNLCGSGIDFKASLEFSLGEKAYDLPRLQAEKHLAIVDGQSLRITVDATNWKRSKKVPLVHFTSTSPQTSFGELVDSATLIVHDYSKPADKQDVKESRGAELVWDETTNTLYYRQKSLGGMMVIVR